MGENPVPGRWAATGAAARGSAAARLLRACGLLLPLLMADGCSLSGAVGGHSIAYNSSVEAATSAVLVMNVLRARDQAPLQFTTVGSIHGALSLSAGFGST